MPDVVRALLIAGTLLLLIVPSRHGATTASYAMATAIMAAINAALILMTVNTAQPRTAGAGKPGSNTVAMIAGVVTAILLAIGARAWLHEILIYPHDPWRADMLVVIQEGIRRFLRGQNPYTMYHVPWDAPLPYGPVMWMPYIAPFVMRVDIRFLSLVGELFTPVAGALAAVACARQGRYAAAGAATIILGAFVFSPDLRGFASIAHTPSYWPGIALLAWLVARGRWWASAIVCGLLVVARTTMAATAPVLLMAVWYQDRRRAPVAALLLALAVVLPYLPFVIWDAASLRYALYGSYQATMKGFVWTSTTWAHNTIGVTGLLLRAGLQSCAELVQVVVMAVLYAFAWRSIRAGGRALPWMAFALFAFCATTLWPVHYVYFDVTILWAAAALAESDWVLQRDIAPAWLVTLASATAVAAIAAFVDVPRDPMIDVGIGSTRPLLYKGFSTDEGSERTFTWIEGTAAEVLVARRSRADADIELVLQPHLPTPQSTQAISVALNGLVLGTTTLQEGWRTVVFRAPAAAWRIGVNELVLSLSSAASPTETHTGDDGRKLSAALDRLTVRTTP